VPESYFYGPPSWFFGVGFFVNIIFSIAILIFFIWATLSIVKSLKRIADSLEYAKYGNPDARPSLSEQKVNMQRQAAIERIQNDQ